MLTGDRLESSYHICTVAREQGCESREPQNFNLSTVVLAEVATSLCSR